MPGRRSYRAEGVHRDLRYPVCGGRRRGGRGDARRVRGGGDRWASMDHGVGGDGGGLVTVRWDAQSGVALAHGWCLTVRAPGSW